MNSAAVAVFRLMHGVLNGCRDEASTVPFDGELRFETSLGGLHAKNISAISATVMMCRFISEIRLLGKARGLTPLVKSSLPTVCRSRE